MGFYILFILCFFYQLWKCVHAVYRTACICILRNALRRKINKIKITKPKKIIRPRYDTIRTSGILIHSAVCPHTASVLCGEECPCVSSADDDFHLERDARSASFRLADMCSCRLVSEIICRTFSRQREQ